MRPSLEAEIIELEKRIATLEKNKIGNLRREHGEIISTYEKMFDTLRFVNFNKVLMVLKINMIEIKSLEEDCSRECSKNQLIILLQKEMAMCLMKMIQIGKEESAIMLDNNARLHDKIRFKRLEVSKMKAERNELLNKATSGGTSRVVVHEKNINRYRVPEPFNSDIFSPTYDTDAYHPKVLKLKKSKIPVLKLPLTSLVETVPFQIRKKPIKVSIPQERQSVFKRPYIGRVVKPKNTHSCERKIVSKIEGNRLSQKHKQQGIRKSSNNFTVMDTKSKINVNSKNNSPMPKNGNINVNGNVSSNSKFETPKSNSKIPLRLNSPSTKKICSKKRNPTNNNKSVTVEEAAIAFKTLNDYCDKIEKMYGTYESPITNRNGHKVTQKKKAVLCNPLKFRTDQKKVGTPEVTDKEKFYGSVETICSDKSEENPIAKTSIVVDSPVEYCETAENGSHLSSSTGSTETGTTVIYNEPVQASVTESSLNEDDQQNICDSALCLETFLSASKCFTPPDHEFRAGGDCFNSSMPGNFRYLDYDSLNTPYKPAQFRAHEHQELANSPNMDNGERRKSEIFHISFNNDKKDVNKSNPPSIFKIL